MAAAAAAEPASPSRRANPASEKLQVALQGYVLRQCRTASERKPFKRRFMILQGATLYYFHAHSMAGQARLLTHLPMGTTIDTSPFTPDGRYCHAVIIKTPNGREYQLSLANAVEQAQWQNALLAAVGQPQRDMRDSDAQGGQSSFAFRVRLSVTSAFASSTIGRKVVKHYLDPASRSLIDGLMQFAAARAGAPEAASLETAVFETAAKIATIFRAGKFPPNFDWTRLYDETNNFCRDFLVYSRDQRLKGKRGETAEMQPLDLPDLLRAGSEVATGWRVILEPHTSAKVLARFDHVTSFFLGAESMQAILLDPAYMQHLIQVDAALRTLLETF